MNINYLKHVPLVDAILSMSSKCVNTIDPISFEALGQVISL